MNNVGKLEPLGTLEDFHNIFDNVCHKIYSRPNITPYRFSMYRRNLLVKILRDEAFTYSKIAKHLQIDTSLVITAYNNQIQAEDNPEAFDYYQNIYQQYLTIRKQKYGDFIPNLGNSIAWNIDNRSGNGLRFRFPDRKLYPNERQGKTCGYCGEEIKDPKIELHENRLDMYIDCPNCKASYIVHRQIKFKSNFTIKEKGNTNVIR